MPLTDSTTQAGAREQVQAAAHRGSCPQRDKPWVLVAAILGSSLAFIEGSVVNLALPAIQSSFSTTFSGVQWVLNAYLLVLGAFMLVGGSLGDRYGLRRIFMLGTAIFGAGAAACAFAPTLSWLVVARLVQGFGGALLVPASLALIGSHFEDDERGRAIGTWAGASALTTAIGPVLGGWLVDQWGWQAVFLMVAPLAAATIAIALWRVPATRPMHDERPDYAGALLLAGALVLLILALVDTGPAWRRIACALAALLAGAGFMRREHRYRHPMLPLALFRSRSFSGANLMTLLLYFALTGALFFLPFNLIQVQGWSTTAAGAALLPFTVIMGFGSTFAGDLIRKFDSRRILTTGPIVTAAGFFALALPGTDAAYVTGFLPGIVIIGVGMTLSVAPLTTVVMNSVSDRQAGLASGVNNTAARLAGVFAIAMLTAVAVASFSGNVEERLRAEGIPAALTGRLVEQAAALAELSAPEGTSQQTAARVDAAVDQAYVQTFRWLVVICGMLALGSGLIAWRFLPGDPPTRNADARHANDHIADGRSKPMNNANIPWPELPPPDAWADTFATVHMWVQIVGKIRLALSPWLNHSWGSTLYVTANGLTTSPVPAGDGSFDIEFDFVHHALRIRRSDGRERHFALSPMSVADFHRQAMTTLAELDIAVSIYTRPVEVVEVIPFEQDHAHASYDADTVNRVWRAFAQADRVFKVFRARFQGKSSPSHFFWGAFDLAVTRFSGRGAPLHPGGAPNCADWVMQEAYSHELASAGFWPGAGLGEAAFYAYAWPEPAGYREREVQPAAAHFSEALQEFVLPYEAVRSAGDPDAALLAFLQSTYESAADLAHWDRASLERDGSGPGRRAKSMSGM